MQFLAADALRSIIAFTNHNAPLLLHFFWLLFHFHVFLFDFHYISYFYRPCLKAKENALFLSYNDI